MHTSIAIPADSGGPAQAPRRATRIVATLGPASSEPAVLGTMIEAGVDVVRLNFSHGAAADHVRRAHLVRAAARKAGREVAIMADLQGPKIRIGRFAAGRVWLEAGTTFTLDAERTTPGDGEGVGLDYSDLARDVQAGDTLLLNDGLIALRVDHVVGSKVVTSVQCGGELADSKGINKLGGGLSAPALSAKDISDIETAVRLGADYIAVSFPKCAADMHEARRLCEEVTDAGSPRPALIAKIERAEAIRYLEEIVLASDGIMVARGDLAVEVGNAAVPGLQKRMIKLARMHDRVVITATQMMESMIQNPVPTRAEVSDVANAVIDGTDAVMCSAETAAGRYPVETIRQMAAICRAAESSLTSVAEPDAFEVQLAGRHSGRIDQSIAAGALFMARLVGARAIVALTESGATALWMSRARGSAPIYAMTPRVSTQRRMALYRNVHALAVEIAEDREHALMHAERELKGRGILRSGDFYAITCGEPMGQAGGTNRIQVRVVA
jgi:pyruvate kinase